MELFEVLRRGYAAGETILGLAKKHGVHRRMVRQALANAIPPARKASDRVEPKLGPVLSVVVVFLASLNVFGGYVVTQRMLAMFRAKPTAPKDGAKK